MRMKPGPLLRWLTFALLCPVGTSLAQTVPELTSDTQLAREGYFVLAWDLPGNTADTLQLQQSPAADFSAVQTREVPPSGAVTLTGLENGEYHFRVGTPGTWSEPVRVVVEHHALSRAVAFFAVGLLLFLTLCTVVLTGHLRLQEKPA